MLILIIKFCMLQIFGYIIFISVMVTLRSRFGKNMSFLENYVFLLKKGIGAIFFPIILLMSNGSVSHATINQLMTHWNNGNKHFSKSLPSNVGIDRWPAPSTRLDASPILKLIWREYVGTSGQYFFQPILADDCIYTASQSGLLTKINPLQGQIIWQKKISTKLCSGIGSDGIYMAVVAENGQLIVMNMHGEKLWEFSTKNEFITAPLVKHGKIILYATNGEIYVFNSADGKLAWHHDIGSERISLRKPHYLQFFDENCIAVSPPDGSLLLLAIDTGNIVLHAPLFSKVGKIDPTIETKITGMVHTKDMLCTVSFQGQLGCANEKNGKIIWQKPFSSYGDIIVVDGAVIAIDTSGTVFAFDKKTGACIWKNDQIKGYQTSGPFLFQNNIVFMDGHGYINFLSKKDGSVVSRTMIDGSPINYLPIHLHENHRLIFLTQKGELLAFQTH